MPAKKISLEQKFWSKVDIKGPDECWIWKGGKKPDGLGYGFLRIEVEGKYKKEYAHRIAFFLANGRWPLKGMVIMHKCDTPLCVTFGHLIEGTQAENVLDCKLKNRNSFAINNPMKREETRAKIQGEKNPSAKLSDKDTFLLFELKEKGISQVKLAKQFNVSPSLVSLILNHKRRAA